MCGVILTPMEITIEQVKKLRDETGISVMQCKKALEEAEGDEEKARIVLQKQSKKAAEKKSERELGSGVVQAYIHNNGASGAMILLSCETDFVARNDDFKKLAYDIAMHITASSPKYLSMADVTEEDRDKAKEAFTGEVEGKPDDLKEKIMEGKLDSFFGDQVLLNQPYIKDPDKTISNLVEEAIQKFGENVSIIKFKRFSI